MPPYLSSLRLANPTLPDRCEPSSPFLHTVSAILGSCIPTNLALVSTVLGTCSIVSWLFAQLPQVYKNYMLKSTAGLSAVFLGEWLLGDLTNLLGSLFTHQATWQIIIACYYVFVDFALCGQWVWYALLGHGRPLRPAWTPTSSDDRNDPSGMNETLDGVSIASSASDSAPRPISSSKDQKDYLLPGSPSSGRNIPKSSNPMDAFRMPNYAQSPSGTRGSWQGTPPISGETPTQRDIRRVAASSSPSGFGPSPKTVLYISLILAVLSNTSTATPVSPFAPGPVRISHVSARSEHSSSATEIAGQILSWMSTFLYLGSRLPQLYKNHVRRSTSGLSPTLFLAAFFGNLFYSTSILTNPCAWYDFAPGEGRGWVDPDGSVRADWVLRAAPFFLGAAGVLIMDGAVGLQFYYFGDNEEEVRGRDKGRDDSSIVTVLDHGARKRRRVTWRRASGWMRGWVPSVSVAGTPSGSRAPTPIDTPRNESPSASIPIRREGALDEARALLGTQRHASPRSFGYGGIS